MEAPRTRFGRGYLDQQYAQSDNLRVRYETHARYSEQKSSFRSWVMPYLGIAPGDLVCDAGCGPGAYHEAIAAYDGRVVAFDLSAGMATEAREHARSLSLDARIVRASAMRIPLRDGACDRVLAAHMLYYMPDIAGALREMRRVLRPGGRITITANMKTPSRFDEVEREAGDALGMATLTENSAQRFSMDDLDLVRSVFPAAERHVREDALVFPAAEPAMRYWMSFAPDQVRGDPAREDALPVLAAKMHAVIDAIIGREGAFRVPKGGGCFVAEAPR
ncbi:MAG TPA: class I SAM-dependent methyltransferase [Dehalococcoidia bacterium]|nr:class I SAM-dependent methyltransferase [Dehalococcoidia bacterium]